MNAPETVAIRPFEPRDYARLAEIGALLDPSRSPGADWLRVRDARRDPTHRQARLVADAGGRVVGWGQVGHMWWAYHPRRFQLRLEVDPPEQSQGVGTRLYAQLAEIFTAWDAAVVRAHTREGDTRARAFAQRRGFVEVRRRWDSHLRVADVRLSDYAGARERLQAHGLRLSTFAAEREQRGDQVVRDLFDLELRAAPDEPAYEADTVITFEQFVAHELDAPQALPEANFLALDGDRIVGVSRLNADLANAHVLDQGFTGVDPQYRGRGIALTLKLATIDYARAHAFQEIHTQNDSENGPMLHINARLGFVKQPATLIYERRV